METPQEVSDDVLRRVQKLLALASDNRANQNEASAAADMAERLMHKYQIEHQDVIIAALKRDDEFTKMTWWPRARQTGRKGVADGQAIDVGRRVVGNAKGSALLLVRSDKLAG